MDSAADAGGMQRPPQRIAFGKPDHVLVKHVRRLWPAYRKRQRQPAETRVVTVCDGLPSRIVSRERLELDAQDRGLDGVEA